MENKKISLILFFIFLIFYSVQIPLHTSKPDIIVFAIRALSKTPILNYAYLAPNTLLEGTALPNYHLGHTLILWLVYHLAPTNLANTIWLSGFVSAISGALIVTLTFLIWQSLGIDKKKSLVIAIVTGLIPSIWEESIIGEVYALQLLFILLFLYAFLKDKILLSVFAFTFANLVSPLSALSFGLLLLKPITKENIKKIFIIGSISLLIYSIIYYLIGSNLLDLFSPLSEEQKGRGIPYRAVTLVIFIFINFNFFIFYLYKGIRETFKFEKEKLSRLAIATLPQLILIFLGSTFFIELGSFQLPVFWALAFPLGYYLAKINYKNIYFVSSATGLVILTYVFWIIPNTTIGSAREEAGKWLRANGYENLCLIGAWDPGITVLYGRNGFDLTALNEYYFDEPTPNEEKIEETNMDSILIVNQKKIPLRVLLSKLKIKGLNIKKYNPNKEIHTGEITKLYENDAVQLYKWKK